MNYDFLLITQVVTLLLLLATLFLEIGVPMIQNLRGDAEIVVELDKRSEAEKVEATKERLDFNVVVPYKNVGNQEGTFIDAYLRIYLPQEQYSDVLLRGKVNLEGVLREDDYFEALLVPEHTGKNLVLRFEAYAKNGKSIAEAMKEIPDVDVALFLESRGRKELYTIKKYFTLTSAEMRKLVK